jgi:tRNA-2-methylthio-N6-dimethylallyladenosine synthase
MKYHIWTEGCQMNVADSQRVGASLERLGYDFTASPDEADVIVLNTCVVRQSAEDKALGRLTSLRPLKESKPGLIINLMGCMVGVRGADELRQRLPFVDVFSPPSDPGPLVSYLTQSRIHVMELSETRRRYAVMDGEPVLPARDQGRLVSAHVPIVYGCSHACTFCIIPFRRGVERSRPAADIVSEIRTLACQGVKEVTLLGQIVDRYGKDLPEGPDLAGLLSMVHAIDGIERIRFLTSHPNYFSDRLMLTVADLPKVMPHIEVPIQAGDDAVLANMKRGYTQDQYRRLIERIRRVLPNGSIATDVIVGFPGETRSQFMETYHVLADLRLDVAHLARYSAREGTVATRRMHDDVPEAEKMERFRLLEQLQEGIAADINRKYVGATVEVLFEEKVRGRWKGRTPTNKLVFMDSREDLRGKLLRVVVTWAGPWSMQAASRPSTRSMNLGAYSSTRTPISIDGAPPAGIAH